MFEKEYKNILNSILNNGTLKDGRNGLNYSLFSVNIKHNLQSGFPMITGRKLFEKNFIHELIWFLSGDTNIKYLKENNVNIWDLWANENGDLGKVYGYQLRSFCNITDQLHEVINSIKDEPESRRHLISLWNPSELNEMKLPPCHYAFQFYVDNNNLNLQVNMRSCDMLVGFPYDIAMYSSLLKVIASETSYKPAIVSFNITDAHIYLNQVEPCITYLNSKTFDLPTLTYIGKLETIKADDFTLFNYKHNNHLKIKINK